jgi:CheY-like chemotaxis protein
MYSGPFNILIADDDDDDHFLLADSFRFFNSGVVRITSVKNGVEALSKLGQLAEKGEELPNGIILDINMPMMDGMETLKKIKADPTLRRIPVYMVTTLRNMDKLEACLENGAANFFTKPNHTREYERIVREIMEGVFENS